MLKPIFLCADLRSSICAYPLLTSWACASNADPFFVPALTKAIEEIILYLRLMKAGYDFRL